jgi:ABC-2 type transport system ATP-binding protein
VVVISGSYSGLRRLKYPAEKENARMTDTIHALEAETLGRRYGRTWALRDCSFQLPAGRVAALVGPNGAGKTTLLHLAVGLLTPTTGSARVFGASPQSARPRVGFVAQDHPLYRTLSVAETLTLGRKLNPHWDDALAKTRLQRLGVPLDRPVGKLSGGQQAQLALTLALAKQPDLLLLDEPVASLDPLARRDFLRALAEVGEEGRMSVLLSSHIIADLERVCDYLIILSAARVQLVGEISEIVRTHKRLTATGHRAPGTIADIATIVEEYSRPRQTQLLVRADSPLSDPAWEVADVSLEEIVLAYLGHLDGATTVREADEAELEVSQ